MLASRVPRFPMPALVPGWRDDFIALRPLETLAEDHPLHRLADAKRAPAQRFHLTLTNPLPADASLRQALWDAAAHHFAAALAQPLWAETVSVFVEPAPSADLVLLRRVALAA
jgi:hypothetical protein